MSRYKHWGFKEENEFRIVAIHLPIKEVHNESMKNENLKIVPEKDRLFRNKNGILIPYIEFFRSFGKTLPIEKIIVGLHKDKDLRADALRIMLRDTDIDIKVVTVSDIPYIN